MNEIVELPATTAQGNSLVGQLVRAEIDQQIATAHAYPRSVSRVMKNVTGLVTISPAAAAECGYALPRGGKPILGPSIRLAEIVAGQWGNCRIGARVVHVDRFEKYVEAEGVFHDLETNTATTARVRRRIVDSRGNLFSDDMIIVTGNAACSIAKRNAILAGVPKAVWQEAYDVALKTVKGDVKTLPERRASAFKAFMAFGVKPEQIFAALEVEGEEDIGLEEIATLLSMHKAIKEGEQKVEDYFPEMGKRKKPDDDGKALPKETADKMAAMAKPKASAEGTKHDPETGEVKDEPQAAQEQAQDEAKPEPEGNAPEGEEDPATAAYARGRKAFGRGMKSDACPPDIRKDEALSEAWQNGWKDARDEADQ